MIPRAKEPFQFFTRLNLTLLTGIKAKNLQELLFNLKSVPDLVIYHHTYEFLRQHHFLVSESPNDFANWVAQILQDEILGEKLTAIDVLQFKDLSDLRQALVFTIESYLSKNMSVRQAPEGKEFHFMRAIRFSIPTSYLAHNYTEFLDCLKKVSLSSLYLHMIEARLRPPLGINDFSHWFDTELDEKTLARQVTQLVSHHQTLEGLRSKIIRLIEKRVQELSDGTS